MTLAKYACIGIATLVFNVPDCIAQISRAGPAQTTSQTCDMTSAKMPPLRGLSLGMERTNPAVHRFSGISEFGYELLELNLDRARQKRASLSYEKSVYEDQLSLQRRELERIRRRLKDESDRKAELRPMFMLEQARLENRIAVIELQIKRLTADLQEFQIDETRWSGVGSAKARFLDGRLISFSIHYNEQPVPAEAQEILFKFQDLLKLPGIWQQNAFAQKLWEMRCDDFKVTVRTFGPAITIERVPLDLSIIDKRRREDQERKRQPFKP